MTRRIGHQCGEKGFRERFVGLPGGDKSGRSPTIRSNAVLLGLLVSEFTGVPWVGSLMRQTPLDSLLATFRVDSTNGSTAVTA